CATLSLSLLSPPPPPALPSFPTRRSSDLAQFLGREVAQLRPSPRALLPISAEGRRVAYAVAGSPSPSLWERGLGGEGLPAESRIDRKSTRLNSSHGSISYAVFCLKKKRTK